MATNYLLHQTGEGFDWKCAAFKRQKGRQNRDCRVISQSDKIRGKKIFTRSAQALEISPQCCRVMWHIGKPEPTSSSICFLNEIKEWRIPPQPVLPVDPSRPGRVALRFCIPIFSPAQNRPRKPVLWGWHLSSDNMVERLDAQYFTFISMDEIERCILAWKQK